MCGRKKTTIISGYSRMGEGSGRNREIKEGERAMERDTRRSLRRECDGEKYKERI